MKCISRIPEIHNIEINTYLITSFTISNKDDTILHYGLPLNSKKPFLRVQRSYDCDNDWIAYPIIHTRIPYVFSEIVLNAMMMTSFFTPKFYMEIRIPTLTFYEWLSDTPVSSLFLSDYPVYTYLNNELIQREVCSFL